MNLPTSPSRGEAPRVLVVNHYSMSADSATGITLRNIFSDWPEQSIRELYIAGPDDPPQSRAHKLPARTFPSDLAKMAFSYMTPGAGSSAVYSDNTAVPEAERDLSRWRRARMSLVAANDIAPVRLPTSTLDWVDAYSPHVIYSALGSVRTMRLVLKVAKHQGIPVVPHFLDDWPATIYSNQELNGFARRSSSKQLANVLTHADEGLVISAAMAVEYGARFGIALTPMMNPVEDTGPERSIDSTSRPLILTYAGGLHLGRGDVLRSVIEQLSTLESSIEMQVRIYGESSKARDLEAEFPRIVRALGTVAPTSIPRVLSESQMLIHIESDNLDIQRFTRLSISTKIPQYLYAARPILCIAPEGLASRQHLEASRAALCLSPDEVRDLPRRIAGALSNSSELEAMGRRGREFASRHHEAGSQRRILHTVLSRASKRL